MRIKKCWNALLGLSIALGAMQVAHAQTPIEPTVMACPTLDRSSLGQYAWGMALRWGTPALLDQLVHQNCIDPNAWQQLGVDEAPMINQVQNATVLSEALALGWRPVEQVQLDRQRNPFYLNPLLAKMMRPQTVDDEALAMFKQAQAKYGFSLAMTNRPSNPTEHEDAMIALANVLPSTLLNESDARTGITPLIAAAAGKYDRLVVALIGRGAMWNTSYAPLGAKPTRGVWDAAFDMNNCVLSTRMATDGTLSPIEVQDRADRSIAALREQWNPSITSSVSTTVPGLSLDMLTGQALWLKKADWDILQRGLDHDKVSLASKRASDISTYQKAHDKRWDYTTLMGTSVPSTVCEMVKQQH